MDLTSQSISIISILNCHVHQSPCRDMKALKVNQTFARRSSFFRSRHHEETSLYLRTVLSTLWKRRVHANRPWCKSWTTSKLKTKLTYTHTKTCHLAIFGITDYNYGSIVKLQAHLRLHTRVPHSSAKAVYPWCWLKSNKNMKLMQQMLVS